MSIMNTTQPQPEPTADEVLEAVMRCLDWCAPLTEDQARVMVATVRHNWRRFLTPTK